MEITSTVADLEARFRPYFTEAWASEGHENVTLVSANEAGRVSISLNDCVFASVSCWCYDILKAAPTNDVGHYYIVTELMSDELEAFKRLATTGTVLGADTVECTQIAARLVALLGGGRLGLCAAADSSSGFSQLSPDEEVVKTDFKLILPKVETISEVSEGQAPLGVEWPDNYQGIYFGHTFLQPCWKYRGVFNIF